MLEMIFNGGKRDSITYKKITATGSVPAINTARYPFGLNGNLLYIRQNSQLHTLDLTTFVWSLVATNAIFNTRDGTTRVVFDGNKRAYVASGVEGSSASLNTRQWTLPMTVSDNVASATKTAWGYSCVDTGTALYMYGGINSSYFANGATGLLTFNKSTQVYTLIAPPGISPAIASTELVAPTGIYYNGAIYYLFGKANLTVNYKYDISKNRWIKLADSPIALTATGEGALFNGKIYIYGGAHATLGSQSQLYAYDIATDTWIDYGVLTIGKRTGVTMFSTATNFYMLGGGSGDLWEFTVS